MFGIGFGEIVVIGIVALLVWGPKELKGLIYQGQKWCNKLKTYRTHLQQSKQRILDDMRLDEIKTERYRQVMGKDLTSVKKTRKKSTTHTKRERHD